MSSHQDRHPDEMISALFDGELAPEEWTAVKEHLEQCPRCQRLLEEIKSISAALPEDPPVPDGLAARVRERLPAGTGRQRVAPPRRETVPFRPARRRITFPLAAGAGLAATLIVGALLVQYLPANLWSRLPLPPRGAEEGAPGAFGDQAGSGREERSAAAENAPAKEQAGEPGSGPGVAAAPAGGTATAEADLAAASKLDEMAQRPADAEGAAAPSGIGSPAATSTDFAAAGERPGFAPGQELPVTVPEEADEPSRTAQEIALDPVNQAAAGEAAPGAPVGASSGASSGASPGECPERPVEDGTATAADGQPALAKDDKARGQREDAASALERAKSAPTAAPPAAKIERLGDRVAEAVAVPSAASVAECRATWGAPRQASWPVTAGRHPERAVGGAGKASGGKSVVQESPRRIRVTVTRERWPELMQRLAAAGVTGTAQLPAPPEWADCAAVNVSLPEPPATPPSPVPPSPETPPPRRPRPDADRATSSRHTARCG